MLPFAPGIFVLGVVFGASAVDHGLSRASAVAMSVFVYSGSAQLAALSVWEQGWPVILLTVLALSLRFSLMTASAAIWLGPVRSVGARARRAALAYLMNDETYAGAAARPREERTAAYLTTAGLTLAVAWIGGTLLGAFGSLAGLFDAWAYLTGPVFAMVFLVLAVLTCTTLPKTFVALLGAILGVVGALWLPPGWHLLFAGIVASLAGPLVERRLPGRRADQPTAEQPGP